jgi:hemin uptake protein HemP
MQFETEMSGAPSRDKSNTDADVAATKRERSVVIANNRIDSQALFDGNREIVIAHGSEIYRLRVTAQNKLILTK